MFILQIVTYTAVEKGMEHKREQGISFGRAIMQVLELLLRLAKGTF